QWLRTRAAQDSRITLLENEENLGFVGTVNRGMALSDSNDVLLLNSDTEVANDWLDRIRTAAYGDQRIASVTPFSTNATICSYPEFCKDNALPPGYDTARIDALCARTNPGAVVDVPTGVGFCMYIRRDSLDHVGLFDTENFGKGYGEENDFCQRAAQAGWRNLHLLDTFVLHTGGVSFGDSKSPREQAAMATLARLHPNYARDVHAFVQADPARPYRLALDAARIAESGLPVVLNVLHDRAGGTVRHVRELAAHLADQAVFLTLTPGPSHSVLLRFAREEEGFQLSFQLGSQHAELLDVLRRLGVGHVHFHHLLGHDPAIRDLPYLLNVSYDFTTHDYFSYCTHISLTGTGNSYAGELGPGQCACCPPDMGAPSHGNVTQWRAANARLLVGARHVLAPSHDTARRISAFVPAVHVLPIPHTDVKDATSLPLPAPRTLHEGAALKIVVIGALSVIKGADVLEAVALEAAKRNVPIEFHLIGYAYRHLQTQPRSRLTIHGSYAEEDLPRLIEWLQPDLAWFPAQWPETYSYTLSAALQSGLPVMVSDLGAFAERVAGRPWSWIGDWDQTPKAWVDAFMAMRDDHFATGVPPTLAQSQRKPLPLIEVPDWHYSTHYLRDLPLPTVVEGGAGLVLAPSQLQGLVPQPTTTDQAKSGVLDAIVYLRSLPVLRGVARSIPAHWQRRVKNWLKA
ncbi:MAG: glycosyltransferase, partial [Comamonadaceae bacterium]